MFFVSNSQAVTFNLLILLLLSIPLSSGRYYKERGTNEEKQERATDHGVLLRLIGQLPQVSDASYLKTPLPTTTKRRYQLRQNSNANYIKTALATRLIRSLIDMIKRICPTCSSNVTPFLRDACKKNLTQALSSHTLPVGKEKTCEMIPKCSCDPRSCGKCQYRQNLRQLEM